MANKITQIINYGVRNKKRKDEILSALLEGGADISTATSNLEALNKAGTFDYEQELQPDVDMKIKFDEALSFAKQNQNSEELDLKIRSNKFLSDVESKKILPNGYKVKNETVSALLENPREYNNLTATEKGKLIPELSAAGFKFPRKLTGEQLEAQANAEAAIVSIQDMQSEIFDGVELRKGNLAQEALPFALGARKFRHQKDMVKDVISRIRSGAALTEQEIAFYGGLLPKVGDTAEDARYKLDQMNVFMKGIAGDEISLKNDEGKVIKYDDMLDPRQRAEVRKAMQAGFSVDYRNDFEQIYGETVEDPAYQQTEDPADESKKNDSNTQGNINLDNRPQVKNSDGSVSTVRSMSFNENGEEILVPTVINGKVVSDQEAIDNYHQTGEYLGKFNNIEDANKYAQGLHEQESEKLVKNTVDKAKEGKKSDTQSEGKRGNIGGDFAIGFGKGLVSTAKGIERLGTGIGNYLGEKITGKKQDMPDAFVKDKYSKPEGTAQKVGFAAEQIAEFIAPGNLASKVSKAKALTKLPGILGKGVRFLTRAGTESGVAGTVATAQSGEVGDETRTAMIAGGLFSAAGSSVKALKGVTGKVGEKIQQTVIRPTAKDLKDGFNVLNLNKYKVGGTLEQTVTKSHTAINKLAGELKKNLKGSKATVDLNKVFKETVEELKQGTDRQFGNVKSMNTVIESLKNEIKEQGGNMVDLFKATNIKRGAGTKGAWSFGNPDPNAKASERVYTTFYNKIKTAIEEAAPKEVGAINKQISDLIPISNAALRRLPVEARNNVIGLTDSIGLFASMFDPRALALIGASKLSKSGKFGQFLVNVSQKKPNTMLGSRFLGEDKVANPNSLFNKALNKLKNKPAGL